MNMDKSHCCVSVFTMSHCYRTILSSFFNIVTTTETIFHPPHLSRPVLDPELIKALVPSPTARDLSGGWGDI
jgi:hypothetical protein